MLFFTNVKQNFCFYTLFSLKGFNQMLCEKAPKGLLSVLTKIHKNQASTRLIHPTLLITTSAYEKSCQKDNWKTSHLISLDIYVHQWRHEVELIYYR